MKYFYISLIIILSIQVLFFQTSNYFPKNKSKYEEKYQNSDSALKEWKENNIKILESYKGKNFDRIALSKLMDTLVPQARKKLVNHVQWLIEILENVSYFYGIGASMENLTLYLKQKEELLQLLQKQPEKDIYKIVNEISRIAWIKYLINYKIHKKEMGICVKGIRSIQKVLPLLESIKDEKQRNKAKIIPHNIIGLLFANVTEKDSTHQKLDSALIYYQKAFDFAQKVEDLEYQMKALSNMATIYGGAFGTGKITFNHQKAKNFYDQSIKIFSTMPKEYQQKFSYFLSNVYYFKSSNYTVEGKLDSALYVIHKGLMTILPDYQNDDVFSVPVIEKKEQIFNYHQTAKLLEFKAHILSDLYLKNKDIRYGKTASKILTCLEGLSTLAQLDKQNEDYMIIQQRIYTIYNVIYQYLIDQYPADKKNIDQKLFYHHQLIINMGFHTNTSEKIKNDKKSIEMDTYLFYLQKNIEEEKDEAKKQVYENEKYEIQKQKQDFIFRNNIVMKPMSFEEVQSKLDDETIVYMLNFQFGRKYIVTITKHNVNVQSLHDFNMLNTLQEREKSQVLKKKLLTFSTEDIGNDNGAYLKNAHLFYKTLVEPIKKDFDGKKRMILCTDESLVNVPFGAFLTDSVTYHVDKKVEWEKLPYLIWQFEKGIIHSSSLQHTLSELPKRSYENECTTFVPVFDNLDGGNNLADVRSFDGLVDIREKQVKGNRRRVFIRDKEDIKLAPLVYAEKEAKHVDSISRMKNLKHQKYWRKDATEQNFKREHNSRIFHVMTHSFYNPNNVNYSGIATFQPSKQQYLSYKNIYEKMTDGIVYLPEILLCNLKTDLVLLSSCESGLADSQLDGNYSLAHRFLHIGVPNVISSLWSIDDEGTSIVMKSFYDFLYASPKPDYDYAWAMQQSIFKTIQDGKYADPKYWAAFRMDLKYQKNDK